MNEERFIYVFSEADRDVLAEIGYPQFYGDDNNRLYIFFNDPELSFDHDAVNCVMSNSLFFGSL